MKIKFNIENIPNNDQLNYIAAYLEGTLKIFLEDNLLFFNQSGILLVEFGLFVHEWINKNKLGEKVDFIYATMDYDKPIISITHFKQNYYNINSIWKEKKSSNLLIEKDIVDEFEKYLIDLDKELKGKVGIKLENILKGYNNFI